VKILVLAGGDCKSESTYMWLIVTGVTR